MLTWPLVFGYFAHPCDNAKMHNLEGKSNCVGFKAREVSFVDLNLESCVNRLVILNDQN